MIQRLRGALFQATGFRARRMEMLRRTIALTPDTTILDVGGTGFTWMDEAPPPRVTLINLDARHAHHGYPPQIRFVVGDALAIPARTQHFDLAFSNSVIEHLYSWENQQRFAQEVRRVARRVWVQTPAREFPIEPHYLAPFVHWLPANRGQQALIRYGSLWGLLARPTTRQIKTMLQEIRLLTYEEMRSLFPDCVIYREMWGGRTKSYIAYTPDGGTTSP